MLGDLPSENRSPDGYQQPVNEPASSNRLQGALPLVLTFVSRCAGCRFLIFGLRAPLIFRQPVQKVFEVFLRESFRRQLQTALFVGGRRQKLRRVAHNVRRQENDELGLRIVFGLAFKEISEERNVAENRNFAVVAKSVVLHQAADHDGLAIGNDNDRVGHTRIDHWRERPRGDRHPLAAIGETGTLGRNDHLDHLIVRDERSHSQDDSNALIRDRVDLVAERVEARAGYQRHFLAEADCRLLVVASQDRRTRKDFRLTGLRNRTQGRLKIAPEYLVNACAWRYGGKILHGYPERIENGARGRTAKLGETERSRTGTGVSVGIVANATFNAEVECVAISDFQEDNFDEHLRFWAIEIGDYLGDILAGFLVGDDDEPARLGISGHRCLSNCPTRIILSSATRAGPAKRTRAAGRAAVGALRSAALRRRGPLGVDRQRGHERKGQRERKISPSVCFGAHCFRFLIRVFNSNVVYLNPWPP